MVRGPVGLVDQQVAVLRGAWGQGFSRSSSPRRNTVPTVTIGIPQAIRAWNHEP